MSFSRRAFARLAGAAAVAAAAPRLLPQSTGAVILNSNENPYGPSPSAMQAMREAMGESFRYPDDAEEALAEAIARLHGVSTGDVLLGNGSSDILRLAAAAFLGPGRKLVTAEPTFESLWTHAKGSEIVKVPLNASYAHDLARMREGSLIYVCNPNNPTATITPKAAVRALLDAVSPDTIVLVDEAYHHYVESSDYETVIPLVAKKPNLVVARTFSKIYAMAGLRCGYAVAQRPLIARLQQHQAFNAMNLMACVAARASLLDESHAALSKKKNREVRGWLASELEKLGYRTLPSEANFVMIDMRTPVRPIIAALREQSVRVGRLFPAMPQHLRVTIGTQAEMERFVAALRVAV